jgi:hypothetical protein
MLLASLVGGAILFGPPPHYLIAMTLMEIIRDLLIFIAVMFALCIVLVVVISKMPDDNPLKRILTAFSYRVAATLAAGAVAVPIEPIPGLDVLYDVAVPIVLIWYWFTFFRDTFRFPGGASTASPPSPIQTRVRADRRR